MKLLDLILEHLDATDDTHFWTLAVPALLQDAKWDLEQAGFKGKTYAQIGACSHWLRPHQTRWTKAGGFAWPSGYGGARHSMLGLPEFDWSVLARWDHQSQEWLVMEKLNGKRKLIFRAALPTRTARHAQAAVHTAWLPTDPAQTRQKPMRPYGFRKIENTWQCVTGVDSFATSPLSR